MARSGALRGNADFRRYWTSETLSTLGSYVSYIAYPLLVLSLGGSPAEAGAVATCAMAARLIFRLPAGHLVDGWDRRRVMFATDVVRAVGVGSIPVAAAIGVLGYPQLLIVAAVEGVATALFSPASTIAVRDVVPEEHLPEALGRSQAAAATASLIGPFVGGWLFTVDRVLPFVVDSASYAVSAVLVARITARPEAAPASGTADRSPVAGLRWLGRQPMLLRALAFAGLLNLVTASAEVAFVLALRLGGTSPSGIGLVMACAGVGGVLGSAAAPWIVRRLDPGPLFLLVGTVWAAGLTLFATTSSPWVLGPVLVVLVLLSPPAGIVVGRAVLTLAPRELIGRVSTASGMVTAGLAATGPVLAGAALQALGVSWTWLLLGGLALVITLVSAGPLLRTRGLLTVRPQPSEAQPQTKPGAAAEPEGAAGSAQDPAAAGTPVGEAGR
ncbi:MFS transporter [Peterkaempfera bronchialis]|uniref:MFS transporter n=1 Tax=Peterkaempfera bronchialis TaxID=2126346 RepID=UPI003C30AEB9